jgi:RHS repeat-associated protein
VGIWLKRGYTGHAHIYEFNLINRNARLYDPTVGRFLAVDNFVGDPALTQSYNRFSYCLNNPLKFTDPSGERAEPSNPNNEFEQVSDWNEADGIFDDVNFDYYYLNGDPDGHKSKEGIHNKTVVDRDGKDNVEGDGGILRMEML